MSTITPSTPFAVDLDPKTQAALSHFARRRRVLLLLRSLAAAAVAWIACMLIVALCDYVWFLSDQVRWLLSVAGYATTIATIWFSGLNQLSDHDLLLLARRLESAEPKLREDLLSAVELADPALANGSTGFRQKLQNQVGQRIGSLDIRRLLPVGLVRRWLSIGVAAVTIFAALFLIPQMQFGRRIARAMLPGLAIQRASLTSVEILKPSPATGFVAEGDAIAVIVRLSGAPAEECLLRWQSIDGEIGETEMTARVTPGAGGTLDHERQFAANLSIGSTPVRYQVLAGDAITLWHTLTPLPRPRVESFQKRYVFPSYAKLDDRVEESEHGDLRALVGTKAEITVRFDQPVENAVLRFSQQGAETPLQEIEGSATEFTTSIPMATPGQYQIDATSLQSALNNPFSPQYSITPVTDSPPVVNWDHALPTTMLVSPLDVVPLAATVSDDLPIDRLMLEFVVNSNPILQRPIDIAQSAREIEQALDWDLLHRLDSEQSSTRLSSGDIIRVRAVAVDRRGQRGESRWLQMLVTDEGFDKDRHAALHQMGSLSAEMVDWLRQSRDLLEPVVGLVNQDVVVDYQGTMDGATQLHESSAELIRRIPEVLSAAQSVPTASSLELSSRAFIDLDQKLRELTSTWSDLRSLEHPDWQKSFDREIREVANLARRFDQEASRLDQHVRATFSQHLTYEIVRDGEALKRSIAKLTADDRAVPAIHIPRHLTVALGRLDEMSDLIEGHEPALLESTSRHYQAWHRWVNTWTVRLQDLNDEVSTEDHLRNTVKQFSQELDHQVRHGLVDGNVTSTLNNFFREVRNQVLPVADNIRRLTPVGQALLTARKNEAEADNAAEAANSSRESRFYASEYDRYLQLLLARLEAEESLHRNRPIADLQYAADLTLIRRAMENVSRDGFVAYRETPPEQVHQELSFAFQMIESMHRAKLTHSELIALLDAERRLDSIVQAKVMHPWWIERISTGLEWPVRYLRNHPDEIESQIRRIDESRYSHAFNQARNRIVSRRWNGQEELLTGDDPITSVESTLSTALQELEPNVMKARETIRKYVLTLSEQAEQAAQRAREAEQRTDQRTDDSRQTARQLQQQQEAAETAAEETVESLVDLANTAEMTDQQQRELAHDADIAASEIQQAVQQAQDSIEAATNAKDQSERETAFEQTSKALDQLAEVLEQTADHFERAENGEDLSQSRAELRQDDQEMSPTAELDDRFEQAESLAESAQRSPEELLEQLEAELENNVPMQQELSDIAEKAAQAAQRTLEQAAREEAELNRSMERSDGAFQEQKRQIVNDIKHLARRASEVDSALVNAAQQSAGWENEAKVRPELDEARKQLRTAIDEANQVNPDRSLLSEIQSSANEMSNAIKAADQALKTAQERSQQAENKDVHQDESAKTLAKQQSERIQQSARDQQVQAINQQKRDLESAKQEATRRMNQAEQQVREAQRAAKRAEDEMKRQPNNRQALEQQAADAQQRESQAQQAADAAKATRDRAEEMARQAEQRSNTAKSQGLPPLDKANPAAELTGRMAQRASDELAQIGEQLEKLSDQAQIQSQLRTPTNQSAQMVGQQQRIEQDVADAKAQLERAARHEQRLGNEPMAQQLAEAAEMIDQQAQSATQQATDALAAAGEDADQAPRANQQVGEATDKLSDTAESLNELLAALSRDPAAMTGNESEPAADSQANNSQSPSQPSQGTPSEAQAQAGENSPTGQQPPTGQQAGTDPQAIADGQQLARTLDELDRALHSSQLPSAQDNTAQQGQPSDQSQPGENPSGSEQASGQPTNQQTGQPSESQSNQPSPGQPTAGDVSPTLANAMNAQAQQAAQQRQQQMNQSQQGNQPGESGPQTASNTSPGEQSGGGEPPDGGTVATDDIDRVGDQWGDLRERRTEDATESRGLKVPSQYRREVEAYFKAVAKRAAQQ